MEGGNPLPMINISSETRNPPIYGGDPKQSDLEKYEKAFIAYNTAAKSEPRVHWKELLKDSVVVEDVVAITEAVRESIQKDQARALAHAVRCQKECLRIFTQ